MAKTIGTDLGRILIELHNTGRIFQVFENEHKKPFPVTIHKISFKKYPVDYIQAMKIAFEQAKDYIRKNPNRGLNFKFIEKGYETLKDIPVLHV